MKSQLLVHGSFFWPGINKAIEEVASVKPAPGSRARILQHPSPTPTPSHPWQMCATDIFTLEGVDHLVVGNFYLKMIFIRCLPPSQSNTNKVISLLKEMFSEHDIPKVLRSDNGPQYVSAQLSWAYHMKPQVHITHNSMDLLRHASSPSNMHSKEPNTVVPTPSLPC